jgi:hypothetical protein
MQDKCQSISLKYEEHPSQEKVKEENPVLGYDWKGVLKTRTGYQICPNTNPVLLTGTGICFLLFQIFKSFTGFRPKFTGINFSKNKFYSKSVN